VTYTVWLGDRLIGETDIANHRVEPRFCTGNFFPLPGHEALVPTTDPSLHVRDSAGNLLPTDWVTVYDLEENPIEDDELEFDEPFDPELEASVEHDAALIRQWMEEREAEGLYDSDDEAFAEEFSRYQLQLRLAVDMAIP
jgi:hypothetical protein